MVQAFLQSDLKQAPLSSDCQVRREVASNTIEDIISKIQHAHPSIRPRVNTPGYGGKKPPLPPPTQVPAPSITEDGEELYEEASAEPPPESPQGQGEDYLSFEPAHNGGLEEQQEVYEAMEVLEEQELYDEPGQYYTQRQKRPMHNLS